MRGEYHSPPGMVYRFSELPPRARRILLWDDEEGDCLGTTSACAENTARTLPAHAPNRNYLRVRGEYSCGMMRKGIAWELPPRARRIQPERFQHMPPIGTTSACAENTPPSSPWPNSNWNYLRVRGEYDSCHDSSFLKMELPPRARRIPVLGDKRSFYGGTTSACAENTAVVLACFLPQWNYLRVRGEYPGKILSRSATWELPPRARRIPLFGRENWRKMGTTSACAENTCQFFIACVPFRNYLRVRGEYFNTESQFENFGELPPRARRILSGAFRHLHAHGTTSACAENTTVSTTTTNHTWNYLRVRGEYPAKHIC